jgi:hypothetical protein
VILTQLVCESAVGGVIVVVKFIVLLINGELLS